MVTARCAVGTAPKEIAKPNTKEPVGVGKRAAVAEPITLGMSFGVSVQNYACQLKWKLFFGLLRITKMAFFFR